MGAGPRVPGAAGSFMPATGQANADLWEGISPEARAATMAAFAAQSAAKLSAQPASGFRRPADRDAAWLSAAVEDLIPRLRECVLAALADARPRQDGAAPRVRERARLARGALQHVSHEKGLFLREVAGMTVHFDAYASARGWGGGIYPWPCEAAELAAIIAVRTRAREAQRGSKGGVWVD